MNEFEEIPPLVGEGILISLIALFTNSPIFAIAAIMLLIAAFYCEWKVGRLDWNFGSKDEVTEDA